jgi:hypothetical protein
MSQGGEILLQATGVAMNFGGLKSHHVRRYDRIEVVSERARECRAY